jgi:hypothetical protein
MLAAQTYFPAIDGTAVLIQHLAEQSAARGDEVQVITTDALGPAGFRTRHLARTTAAHKSQGLRIKFCDEHSAQAARSTSWALVVKCRIRPLSSQGPNGPAKDACHGRRKQ